MARYTRHEMALGRREAQRRGLPVPKGVKVVETNAGRLIYVDATGKAFPQKIAESINRAARNRKDADVQDEARWIEYQQTGIPITPADVRAIDSARGRRGVRGIIDAINSGGVRPDQQREYIQAARRMAGLGATAYREPVVHIDRRGTWKWQPLAKPKPRVITDAWEPEDPEAWAVATKEVWSADLAARLRDWMGQLGLRAPLPASPARLAARIFQGFLSRPLAYIPWELAVLAANVVEPYYIAQPKYDDYPLHVDHAIVSDLNCAYGAVLRTLPDLSAWRGRWRRVTEYAGPWGIYQTESGPQAGCAVEVRGHQVEWGWVWDDNRSETNPRPIDGGDLKEATISCRGPNLSDFQRRVQGNGQTDHKPMRFRNRNFDMGTRRGLDFPFASFVDWCYAAHGPFPRLMRRLPVYFVGKCAEAEFPDRGVMRAGGHYYPVIWVWVTQQLRLEMERVTKLSGAFMAYIDAIHTRNILWSLRASAFPEYGPAIGQWKIEHEGPAVYWGLNHYAMDCVRCGKIIYKHQGVEG